MSHLGEELSQSVIGERRTALRTLLQTPLLTAEGPQGAAFVLIRRHAAWLREFFSRHTGWILTLDAETARLRKIPAQLHNSTHPARDPVSGSAFSRRRYLYFNLALAALERSDRQTTLGRLAEAIGVWIKSDDELVAAGAALDLGLQEHRRDLVHAVRLLLELRILTRIHGEEQSYVAGQGDVLYTVRRSPLSRVLSVLHPPSNVTSQAFENRLSELTTDPQPDSEEARLRQLRHGLTRRLLDDPVIYTADLSADQQRYLLSQRGHLTREIAAATGLVAEIRREGLAMVDETGDLTDRLIPEDGTLGHATLLVAEYLCGQLKAQPGIPVGRAEVRHFLGQQIARFGAEWKKEVLISGAEDLLAARVLEHLASLELIQCQSHPDDGVIPMAALARYQLTSQGGSGPKSSPKTKEKAKKPTQEERLW